jgi:hypothetical protein
MQYLNTWRLDPSGFRECSYTYQNYGDASTASSFDMWESDAKTVACVSTVAYNPTLQHRASADQPAPIAKKTIQHPPKSAPNTRSRKEFPT